MMYKHAAFCDAINRGSLLDDWIGDSGIQEWGPHRIALRQAWRVVCGSLYCDRWLGRSLLCFLVRMTG